MSTILDKFLELFRTKPAPPAPEPDAHATMPLPEPQALPRPDSRQPMPFSSSSKRLNIGVAQDVGKVRTHNEDVLLVFTGELAGLDAMPGLGLFIVADGMGGHASGERASGIAARTVARVVLERILPFLLADPYQVADRPSLKEVIESAMEAANRDVFISVPQGGGTTLTCALVVGEQVVLSHVGDSRAYVLTPDTFEQITRDHSLVQKLQEMGQLSAAEAAVHPQRNVLYRAVGQGEGLEVDIDSRRLPPGAMLLLCSDGLWSQVPDDKLNETIRQMPHPQAACDALVAAANAAGGSDNITAVLVQLPH